VHPDGGLQGDKLKAGVLVLGGIESSAATTSRRGSTTRSAAAVTDALGVVDAVPVAALADLLRAHLEVGDLDGDVAARPPGVHLVDAVDEEVASHVAGQAADAVARVVDAVLDVVGEVADLLHPVLHLVVVPAWWSARR